VKYVVSIFANEDARFFEAEVNQMVTFAGEILVEGEDIHAALEAAYAVGNRQGTDLRGVRWSRFTRSASVGDAFIIRPYAGVTVEGSDEFDPRPSERLFTVASFGFTEQAEWEVGYGYGDRAERRLQTKKAAA
jgi:hypothetical protein